MPISVDFPVPHPDLTQTFAKVLRDDPDHAASLNLALQQPQENDNDRIAAAHFNGQPVGVAVLRGRTLSWMVIHPATRGRGVGHDFLRRLEDALGHQLILPDECRP